MPAWLRKRTSFVTAASNSVKFVMQDHQLIGLPQLLSTSSLNHVPMFIGYWSVKQLKQAMKHAVVSHRYPRIAATRFLANSARYAKMTMVQLTTQDGTRKSLLME